MDIEKVKKILRRFDNAYRPFRMSSKEIDGFAKEICKLAETKPNAMTQILEDIEWHRNDLEPKVDESRLLTDEEIFKIIFNVSWNIFPKSTYASNIKTYIGDTFNEIAKAQLAKDQERERIELQKQDKVIAQLNKTIVLMKEDERQTVERIFKELDEAFGSFLSKKVVYQNLKERELK